MNDLTLAEIEPCARCGHHARHRLELFPGQLPRMACKICGAAACHRFESDDDYDD